VGLARVKKEYGAQSREAAKKGSLSAVAESQTVRTTISLRLCALARRKIRRGGQALREEKPYSSDSKTQYRVNS
jgi:hypothetical protein